MKAVLITIVLIRPVLKSTVLIFLEKKQWFTSALQDAAISWYQNEAWKSGRWGKKLELLKLQTFETRDGTSRPFF